MNRRTFLYGIGATSATISLAGCGEAETEPTGGTDDATPEPTPEPADDGNGAAEADDAGEEADDVPDPADAPQGEDVLDYKGLVIVEHELVEPEDDFGFPEVVGIVENNRDEQIDYVHVAVRVYDHDGHMIESWFTNVTDLQAGGSWRFEMMINEDWDDIAEYDIRITDSPF